MKLSQLLKQVPVCGSYSDVEISDVTADSRKVTPGALFVCIKGDRFDGHAAAQQAIADGAAAVVAEKETGAEHEVLTKNTREAYALICAAFFGNPADELDLIGLTGTNGKTTSTFLIKSVLEAGGNRVGLIGTVHNAIGDEILPAQYTTPDAYELQGLFRKMVDAGCKYCVMEVSSQALAQGRCYGLEFEIGVFTNLTQDHLDYHGSMGAYKQAKRELFLHSKTAIMNRDDIAMQELLEGTSCDVITYSVKSNDADYTAKNIRLHADSISYELLGEGVIGRLKCMIPGSFTVYNTLSAACVCLQCGMAFPAVLDAFRSVKGVTGRIEVVPTDTDYTVIIDYAHSPDGLKNILQSVKEFAPARVICVFGCGGDRDKTKRPQMAKIAASYADFLVVTSDNPRTEDPDTIIKDIVAGLKGTNVPYEVITNRTEAIRYAMTECAQPDDIVLLAGKGHETYQIIGTEKQHYDEREIIAGILEEQTRGEALTH